MPAIGERRTENGQTGEWDGQGWMPVKERPGDALIRAVQESSLPPQLAGPLESTKAIPGLAKNFLKGVGKFAGETPAMIRGIVTPEVTPLGTVPKVVGDTARALTTMLTSPEARAQAGAGIREAVGSPRAVLNTAMEDPFLAAQAVSGVATAGGGLASKIPGLARVAQSLGAVGAVTDPTTLPLRLMGKLTPVYTPQILAKRWTSAAYTPTQTAIDKAGGDVDALLAPLVEQRRLPTRRSLGKMEERIIREAAERDVYGAQATQAGVTRPRKEYNRIAEDLARKSLATGQAPSAEAEKFRQAGQDLATKTGIGVGPDVTFPEVIAGKEYGWNQADWNVSHPAETWQSEFQKAQSHSAKEWVKGVAPEYDRLNDVLARDIPARDALRHAVQLGSKSSPLGWRTFLPFTAGAAAGGAGYLTGMDPLLTGLIGGALGTRTGLAETGLKFNQMAKVNDAIRQGLMTEPAGQNNLIAAANRVAQAVQRTAALPSVQDALKDRSAGDVLATALTGGQTPAPGDARKAGHLVKNVVADVSATPGFSRLPIDQMMSRIDQAVQDASVLSGGLSKTTKQRDRATPLVEDIFATRTTERPEF